MVLPMSTGSSFTTVNESTVRTLDQEELDDEDDEGSSDNTDENGQQPRY